MNHAPISRCHEPNLTGKAGLGRASLRRLFMDPGSADSLSARTKSSQRADEPSALQVRCRSRVQGARTNHPLPYTGMAAPLIARAASEARNRITSAIADGSTHLLKS